MHELCYGYMAEVNVYYDPAGRTLTAWRTCARLA
jgi:hypothetical protein